MNSATYVQGQILNYIIYIILIFIHAFSVGISQQKPHSQPQPNNGHNKYECDSMQNHGLKYYEIFW